MEKQIALKCEGIKKTYGSGDVSEPALRGISLICYKGEMTLLMGPSGCGKTTLLSIISTILTEDGGTVEVLGKNLDLMNQEEKTEFRIQNLGFLFQSFYLIPSLTVVENVEIPLILQGKEGPEIRKRALDTLDEIGIATLAHRYPPQLSHGQQQRAALSRAIVHRPSLIICDEPTSALDQKNGMVVMDLLKHHAVKPDNAVIVATHDKRTIAYADRIAEMNDGRILNVETNIPKEDFIK